MPQSTLLSQRPREKGYFRILYLAFRRSKLNCRRRRKFSAVKTSHRHFLQVESFVEQTMLNKNTRVRMRDFLGLSVSKFPIENRIESNRLFDSTGRFFFSLFFIFIFVAGMFPATGDFTLLNFKNEKSTTRPTTYSDGVILFLCC